MMTGSTRRVSTPDGVNLALHRIRAPPGRAARGAARARRVYEPSLLAAGRGLAHFRAPRDSTSGSPTCATTARAIGEPRRGAWTFEDWALNDTPTAGRARTRGDDGAPLAWVGHSAGVRRDCAGSRVRRRGGAAQGNRDARHSRAAPSGRRAANAGRHNDRRITRLAAFPARLLRFGNEDEAAEIIGEWMEWNVRGDMAGTTAFDYFAGLAALSAASSAWAGGSDRIFAPPACGLPAGGGPHRLPAGAQNDS